MTAAMDPRIVVARLGTDGAGVADDGLRLPGTLPGEVVTLRRDGTPAILCPSPDRVARPCRHARSCGGCALQHASDRFVAAWKQDRAHAALADRGLVAPPGPMHVSPPGSRRRATLAGRRLKSGALVGFRAARSHEIVAIPECRLLHPRLMAALPALRALVTAGAARSATLRLSLTATETGTDVAVAGGKAPDAGLRARLARIATGAGFARLTWDGEPIAQTVPPRLTLGRAPVHPPPGAFLQATEMGEAALRDAVRDAVGDAQGIADLFAGIGTFALQLAATAQLHAVDASGPALAALAAGWRRAGGLHPVTTETRDLFARPMTGPELSRFDAVVIDPPRSGAPAQMRALAAHGPARIAAVSCNPESFARDAAILVAGGYTLDWVRVVDQFRWSAHVELAAAFSRGGACRRPRTGEA
jgi:23S rRNA (uracil1939-C5)-methyltransferase